MKVVDVDIGDHSSRFPNAAPVHQRAHRPDSAFPCRVRKLKRTFPYVTSRLASRVSQTVVVPQNLIRRIHDNLRTHLRIRQIDGDIAGMASRMATKTPRALGSGL